MEISLIRMLDILGTFAFAISGIKMAWGRNIDWFGAYVIGLSAAIGGGTIRDLLLNVTPFWMTDFIYILTTGVALFATLLFKDRLFKWNNTLFLFDTVGLGLFTIVGITKSQDAGLPFWVCIIMGTITGSLGGVLRDILLNKVPLLFKKNIYAIACIAGGVVYFILDDTNLLPKGVTQIIGALTVIIFRLVTMKYGINLPTLSSKNSKLKEN